MPTKAQIEKYNKALMKKLSVFLNLESDYIKEQTVEKIARECDLDRQDAYMYLLASAMYMNLSENEEDRELFELYFPDMVRELDPSDYESDPYMLEIYLDDVKCGDWEIKTGKYAPYEAFVHDDFKYCLDSRVIAQIGYFPREYNYPVVYQNGREWMLITPNEINTMKKPISLSHGKVLTFGLGLGYFAFMTARRDNVESVTVVERDESVIELFEKHIRDQIADKDKIRIIRADAFDYAEHEMAVEGYDFVFADIWHDPSDGVELYKKFKSLENLMPNAEYYYWIEETLKYYM